jgi:octaprenyl-diphosphate synthase
LKATNQEQLEKLENMNDNQTLLSKYEQYFHRINDELKDVLNSRISLAKKIGDHTLLGGGKRLRPLLFVLSCFLCDYRADNLYRLSTIFEYIHTASLLHDDVLDNADLRRRKPSANSLWGNHAAVLEGDFLYSKSFSVAVEAGNPAFMKLITATTTRMAEGQILELIHTNNWDMDRDLYLDIIAGKTAVLISAACACGGIMAGVNHRAVQSLRKFGHRMGMAFQLVDDLLDYTASQKTLGKPVGNDIREGKITLPLIYTLGRMASQEKKRLQDLFQDHHPSVEDYAALVETVRENGVLDEILLEAREYIREAAICLDEFPDSEARRNLLELNQFIVERHC